jgi:uncharacterized protein
MFRSSGILVAFVVLVPFAASAQSFNCRTADRPDEVLICQDSQLSALDEKMSTLYYNLRNRLQGVQRRRLEVAQSAWLKSRIACGRGFQCIEEHYRRRIAEFQDVRSTYPAQIISLCRVADPTSTPLNVRTSPNGRIVGTLGNGMSVAILDRMTDRKGETWVYVGGPEDRMPMGWVYANYLDCRTYTASNNQPNRAPYREPERSTEETNGTGFFVSRSQVLTNFHVVEACAGTLIEHGKLHVRLNFFTVGAG